MCAEAHEIMVYYAKKGNFLCIFMIGDLARVLIIFMCPQIICRDEYIKYLPANGGPEYIKRRPCGLRFCHSLFCNPFPLFGEVESCSTSGAKYHCAYRYSYS